MTEQMIIDKLTKLLGETWRSVRWSQMRGRYSTDVFAHRLIVASRQETLPAFFTKLCHGLSLQAPINITSKDIDDLKDYEQGALKLIREWPQYFVYKAYEYAKQKSRENKKKKQGKEIVEQKNDIQENENIYNLNAFMN